MIKKLSIAVDFDDTIGINNQLAIDAYNAEYGTNYTINDIKKWNDKDDPTLKYRIKCYNDPEFVSKQVPYPGAKEFIKKLCKIADVYIASAVPPQCMTARAMSIKKHFPWIKDDHIILGSSKHLYDIDILLDDASHNIKDSIAKYPVLIRRPWNADLSGVLAVNTYDDFLHIVEVIRESHIRPDLDDGGVICLVGPSGSGKTAIMTELTKDENFVKPLTTTTRLRRIDEPDMAYRFVTEEMFLEEQEQGLFLETTVYSGHHYGTTSKEVDSIVDAGKYAVIPIDICGAIAIKNKYRKKAIILFVNRDEEKVIYEIVSRSVSSEEKTSRIVSLHEEYANKVFCEAIIENNDTLENACEQVREQLRKFA